MNTTDKMAILGAGLVGLLGVGLIVALIIVGPLALLWVMNTLFGLGVAYTLKNWFAGLLFLWLTGQIKMSGSTK